MLAILSYYEALNFKLYLKGQTIIDPLSGALSFPLARVDGKSITFGKLIVSLAFLIAGVYFSKIFMKIFANKVLYRFMENRSAAHAFENLTFYILVTFFTLLALQVANIPMTIFGIIGGAIALSASLGSQNIMNNVISGLIILIERPVKIGDIVYVDGLYGRIENIGMRATIINSNQNRHLIVPNSKLLENNVNNYTHESSRVRSEIKVGVRYGTDVETVKKCLTNAALVCPKTLKSQDPTVIFDNFGESSLEFSLIYDLKILNLLDERAANSFIRETIVANFKKEDIIVAFPQRDVHVHMVEKNNEIKINKAA